MIPNPQLISPRHTRVEGATAACQYRRQVEERERPTLSPLRNRGGPGEQGPTSNRFRSIQTVCEDGELFSDEILSCLDQEDSEKELNLLMLAASQQYESTTTTDNNSAHASQQYSTNPGTLRPQQQPTTVRLRRLRDPPSPQPQRFLHASLHRKRVKRYKKEDRIVSQPKQKRTQSTATNSGRVGGNTDRVVQLKPSHAYKT